MGIFILIVTILLSKFYENDALDCNLISTTLHLVDNPADKYDKNDLLLMTVDRKQQNLDSKLNLSDVLSF